MFVAAPFKITPGARAACGRASMVLIKAFNLSNNKKNILAR
jgi:hypothetical protein